MKYIIVSLIAVVLLSSCNISQRRYMPGYSVNWKHKNSKPIASKEPALHYNDLDSKIEPIATKEMSDRTIPVEKLQAVSEQKNIQLLHKKNITSNHITSNSTLALTVASSAPKTDKGQPQFYTGDEQEDDHARKSLIYGVLSLASPAAGFLIMLGIVLSIGSTLAKAPTYALAIFAIGCTGGLIFALFAIINGFIAINEINASPDTYDGTGDAVLGIILAAIVPIGLVAYILLRSH